MNPQDNQDYKRRLEELEAELNQNRPLPLEPNPGQPLQRQESDSQLELVFNHLSNWFNRLPKGGKIAVAILAALVGFSLLRGVLQLVASLISLAVLGGILYLVYKFFVAPKASQ